MDNYIIKTADINDINKRWDELIRSYPEDLSWIKYKKNFLESYYDGTRLFYYGILNGKTICEATAIISLNDRNMQNKEFLIDEHTAYLTGFRTDKEYENKGYFSKLYKYMENDLNIRGYRRLTLGIEPCEVRNIMIYFHLGYVNYIKYAFETYYAENENKEGKKVIVNYYYKDI